MQCTEGPTIYYDEFKNTPFIYSVAEGKDGRRFALRCYPLDPEIMPTTLSFEDCCQKAKEEGAVKCLHYQKTKEEAADLVIESFFVESLRKEK